MSPDQQFQKLGCKSHLSVLNGLDNIFKGLQKTEIARKICPGGI